MNDKIVELFIDFTSRKTELTDEIFEELEAEHKKVNGLLRQGKISIQEATKRHLKLINKLNGAIVIFDNKEDFIDFSSKFVVAKLLAYKTVLDVLKHELQHAVPYTQFGIKSKFAWIKLNNGNYLPIQFPYGDEYNNLTLEEIDRLHYLSLRNVRKRSKHDSEDLRAIEQIYGYKKTLEWRAHYKNMKNQ